MPRLQPGPPCEVCGDPSVARNLCQTHYKRWYRHGTTKQTRPNDWGKRYKHPLWQTWKWASRKGTVPEWDNFWLFVEGVGERPSERHRLMRNDASKPFGPDNCYWLETKPNPDAAERMREYRQENPTKFRGYELKRSYGISVEDYDRMLEKQGGKCAICGEVDDHHSLAVDHCHETGAVRGLLCSLCNRGLGLFKDRADLLTAAIKHLG